MHALSVFSLCMLSLCALLMHALSVCSPYACSLAVLFLHVLFLPALFLAVLFLAVLFLAVLFLPALAPIPVLYSKKDLKTLPILRSSVSAQEAGEEGLEPPFTVLETVALPLNYSPLMRNFRMPEYNTILIDQCQ